MLISQKQYLDEISECLHHQLTPAGSLIERLPDNFTQNQKLVRQKKIVKFSGFCGPVLKNFVHVESPTNCLNFKFSQMN